MFKRTLAIVGRIGVDFIFLFRSKLPAIFCTFRACSYIINVQGDSSSATKIHFQYEENGESHTGEEEGPSSETSEEDKETVELEFDVETPCCGPSHCHTEAGCGIHTAEGIGKAFTCILSRLQNVCLG